MAALERLPSPYIRSDSVEFRRKVIEVAEKKLVTKTVQITKYIQQYTDSTGSALSVPYSHRTQKEELYKCCGIDLYH